MSDTATRRAQLAAELAALPPDDDDEAADVVEATAEGNAAVAEAVGDAVATAVEAADNDDPAPVVVIDTPSPEEQAIAAAIVIEADADAQSQIIDAQAQADIDRMEAAARIEEGAGDLGDPVGDLLDDVLGSDEGEEFPAIPDPAPASQHWFWRPMFGGRR